MLSRMRSRNLAPLKHSSCIEGSADTVLRRHTGVGKQKIKGESSVQAGTCQTYRQQHSVIQARSTLPSCMELSPAPNHNHDPARPSLDADEGPQRLLQLTL